jgi:hypothetical protein
MMAAPVASPSRFRLNIEVSEMITWQRNNIQAADMLEAILSLPNFLRRASKPLHIGAAPHLQTANCHG